MAGTVVASTINNDTGLFSTNNAYLGIAKAWINFNGSTAAIRASFNVTSLTKQSTGNYTVTFSTAMADANYAAIVGTGQGDVLPSTNSNSNTPTTTTQTIRIRSTGGVDYDTSYVYMAVFD